MKILPFSKMRSVTSKHKETFWSVETLMLGQVQNQGNKHTPGQIHIPLLSHPHRNNSDKTVNKNRHQLLQVCWTLGLYTVNGRLRGDSFGHYTHSSPLDNSTADYSITDVDPFHLRAFTVSPLTPLSHHSETTLHIRRTETNNKQKQGQLPESDIKQFNPS